jgi:ferric-dicitrate binding protein FerR (iron transport regulator)
MNDRTQEKSERILDEYFSGVFPVVLEERIRTWLIDEKNREAKDLALEKIWNRWVRCSEPDRFARESIDNVTALLGLPPTKSPDRSASELRKKIGRTDGQRGALRKRSVWLRIAAVVIPLIVLSGVGVWMYSQREPEWITTVADAGVQVEFSLPDGTQVWLNPSSRLSYPGKFKIREVRLEGEAFFSVTRNERSPFTVTAGGLEVIVLGTQFMVNAPTDKDRSTVTLHNGSVEVETGESQTLLEPGEQLQYYHQDNSIRIEEVPLEDWTRPSLDFYAASLEEIFRSLEENYDVKIRVDRPSADPLQYTIRFTRDQPLDEVLRILSNLTRTFGYTIGEANTVDIMFKP